MQVEKKQIENQPVVEVEQMKQAQQYEVEKEAEQEPIQLYVPQEMETEEVNFLTVSFQDERFRLQWTSIDLDLAENNLSQWKSQPSVSQPSS